MRSRPSVASGASPKRRSSSERLDTVGVAGCAGVEVCSSPSSPSPSSSVGVAVGVGVGVSGVGGAGVDVGAGGAGLAIAEATTGACVAVGVGVIGVMSTSPLASSPPPERRRIATTIPTSTPAAMPSADQRTRGDWPDESSSSRKPGRLNIMGGVL